MTELKENQGIPRHILIMMAVMSAPAITRRSWTKALRLSPSAAVLQQLIFHRVVTIARLR